MAARASIFSVHILSQLSPKTCSTKISMSCMTI